jgi:hypothetical protein
MSRLSAGLAFASLLLLSGCTTGKFIPNATLEGANFRVVKADAQGEDYGFRLLGIIPIIQPSWADAVRRLKAGVDSNGKAISLANVTQQKRNIYLILFSIPKVTVSADVVEFLDAAKVSGAPGKATSAMRSRPASPASPAPH